MGKRGGWFSAVRRALIPDYKEKKDQRPSRKSSKKRWFGRQSHADLVPYDEEMGLPIAAPPPQPPPLPPPPPPPPSVGDLKVVSHVEDEQSKNAYSIALATAVAAEAAVAAAQAAAEVIRLTSLSRFSGRSRQEMAAVKIQTAFRGYMARRALKALKGLVRLKNLIQGQSVRRQATTTLQCMQTLARVQSQIRARRIRMSEENRALHRQREQQQEKELEKLKAAPKEKLVQLGDEWNDSTKSREQVEKRLQYRQEAAMRRERALAYAFSHQKALKNLRSPNPTVLDPINPAWGWSWLERWMDARPWETTSASEYIDRASIKSTASRAMSIREATPSHSNRPSPTAQKPRRPQTFSPSPSNPPSVASRTRPCSPKAVNRDGRDEDLRSTLSTRTEQPYFRRHSIGGASLRDDDSHASSSQVPSYMAPTKATNARSRLPSPLGLERNASTSASERGSAVPSTSAKKRLSLGSPTGPRRHSGPPKIEIGSTPAIGPR